MSFLEQDTPRDRLKPLLEYLECNFNEYPYAAHKDLSYFAQLLCEFYDLEVFEELKQYHAWVLDQPEDKKIYYRSRFRTWLKTARQFKITPSYRPSWVSRTAKQK